jgi:hypothetical protein
MLPETVAGNPPRSIVTDHYLLDQCNPCRVGPANDDQVRGTYLAYGISLDLSSDRKVASILGPAALSSLIRMALLVYDGRIKLQAPSSKRLTAGSG